MNNVKALLFDVFGTVVDWRTSVERELTAAGEKHGVGADWAKFAQEWRSSYITQTRRIAVGGAGPLNVDVMHRQILDGMLSLPEWSHLAPLWSEEEREELNLVWHRLSGWPDSSEGLALLKEQVIVATLSNGNVRLLLDMAKFADLPWDMLFSTELFQTFKPNHKAYLEAMRHLSLGPHQCAMVAAHIYDLRAAGSVGMSTIYIRRPNEEMDPSGEEIKSKEEGGEVDCVVDSLVELANVLAEVAKEGMVKS